jgi:dihydroorotate dehydrogenase
MAVDLTTDFCRLTFKNPIIVAAGLINSAFGSDKSAEYWFSEGIKKAKEGQALVIANLAGFTPEEAAGLAAKAEGTGADMIKVPTHCPYRGEILIAMFPGMNFPEPKLTDLEPMKQSVRMIKRSVSISVTVKLSGTFAHILPEWALGVKEAGADGLTGPAITPITLRRVLEIAQTIDLPIVGVGGVGSASDVVEYLMAGASLVGVRGLTLKKIEQRKAEGLQAVTKPVVPTVLSEACNGCGNCERVCVCGAAKVLDKIARIDPELCSGCGLCVSVCPTDALVQEYYPA